MASISIAKRQILPSTFTPNALYFINLSTTKTALYVADSTGTTLREITSPTQQAQIDQILITAGAADVGIRNRLMNPQGLIDQVNEGANIDVTGTNPYICDRWKAFTTAGATIRFGRILATGPADLNYIFAQIISPKSGSVSTDQFRIVQAIEGFMVADMKPGVSGAVIVRLVFKTCHSVAGKYSLGLYNAAANRSVVLDYTQTTANVWQPQTLTVRLDTTGTWNTTTGIGINVAFDFGSGDDNLTSTPGTWVTGLKVRSTGSLQPALTAGAIVRFSDIQLAHSTVPASFEVRPYELELSMCQRYYERIESNQYGAINDTAATTAISLPVSWKVVKRVVPTVAIANGVVQNAGVDGMTAYQASQATKTWYLPGAITAAADF